MAAIPSGVFLARLGGDEFAVLLDATGPDPVEVATGVRAALTAPAWAGGQPVHLGGSIGVAHVHAEADEPADLMRRADLAMYRAKQTGEGVCVFDAAVDAARADRLSRLGALRRAIAVGELRLYWQPILDLASGRITSAEALVRWQQRDRLVPPDEFIPLAEQSGLVLPLTRWVVDVAAATAAEWARSGRPLHIAVNVATSVLAERNVAGDLADRFARAGVEPSDVTLELSEASLLNPRAREGLRRCAERGFRLAIDDFGTGYASFGYLKDLAVDIIKIDRSFVRTLAADTRDEAIVGSIGFVAERLGLRTVAEGVEDADALARLRSLGIDAAQGFLMTPPLPRSHFEEWWTEWDQGLAGGRT
jgi:EAL domain-containing protein (putative c-di-GMP-specific phosphodiesterase class I)